MHTEIITDAKSGKVTQRNLTPDEISALAPTADDVRAQRNHLLATSDWTQIPDAPVDQAAWATYRQALRDVPQQEGFPADVIWPTPPSP